MDLTITLKGASEDFARQVLAMFVGAEGVVVSTEPADTEWTADRAYRLLRMTNARSLLLIDTAVNGNGWVDGPAYRKEFGEQALRGPSATITKAIKRGAAEGLWSSDIPHPLRATTPAPGQGWSKTGGYFLDAKHLPVFRTAMERYAQDSAAREK
ncbi:hypothetical protein ACFXJ5_41065 [Streptomyces sp. NPDC059373]